MGLLLNPLTCKTTLALLLGSYLFSVVTDKLVSLGPTPFFSQAARFLSLDFARSTVTLRRAWGGLMTAELVITIPAPLRGLRIF